MDKRALRARTMREHAEQDLLLLESKVNKLRTNLRIFESTEQEYNETRARLAQLLVLAHAHLTPD